MKKLLLFTVLLAFLLGSLATATEFRTRTMGFANNVVKDIDNIWLYPSTINDYPRLLTLAVDGSIDYMGAHFQFGQDSETPWVLGGYFADELLWPEVLDPYFGEVPEVDGVNVDNRRIALFYGRQLGEMPFGFMLDLTHSSQTNDWPDNDVTERSFAKYKFGFGLTTMEGKLDLGAELGLMTWTIKNAAGEDIVKPSGNMEFNLRGRYWMDPMGRYTLIPHAMFGYEKQGREDYIAGVLDDEETGTWMIFDAGMGLNYEADEDVLAIADIGFQFKSEKFENKPATGEDSETKGTDLVFPYFRIGVDAKIFKWLDIRAGTFSTWDRVKYEPDSERTYKANYVDTDLLLGVGLHWGNFEIDAELDPEFVTDGPNFISGEEDDLFWGASLIYWLD